MANVVGKAVNLIEGAGKLGKKIMSNMSVDGGIKGLSRATLKNTGDAQIRAARAVVNSPLGAAADDGLQRATVLSGARYKAAMRSVAKGESDAFSAHAGVLMSEGYSKGHAMAAVAAETGKQYFTGGTRAQNATRMGVAAGAYMGVNIAGRKISGGSVGYNNKGERDIAGIPML